jgi:hypothetical protein
VLRHVIEPSLRHQPFMKMRMLVGKEIVRIIITIAVRSYWMKPHTILKGKNLTLPQMVPLTSTAVADQGKSAVLASQVMLWWLVAST